MSHGVFQSHCNTTAFKSHFLQQLSKPELKRSQISRTSKNSRFKAFGNPFLMRKSTQKIYLLKQGNLIKKERERETFLATKNLHRTHNSL